MRSAIFAGAILAATGFSMGGCGLLGTLIPQPLTTVRLVNNSDFDVRVTVVYDDEQDTPRAALVEFGNALEFTLAPGESTSFSRDCDQIQAITLDNAELRVVGGFGPSFDSDVFRDGDDFGCGDVIEFTFDHSDVLVDFDAEIAVSSN